MTTDDNLMFQALQTAAAAKAKNAPDDPAKEERRRTVRRALDKISDVMELLEAFLDLLDSVF